MSKPCTECKGQGELPMLTGLVRCQLCGGTGSLKEENASESFTENRAEKIDVPMTRAKHDISLDAIDDAIERRRMKNIRILFELERWKNKWLERWKE